MSEYSVIFRVLGIILVEIRGTENLNKARILADIFHNVPALISSGIPQEEVMKEIMKRAEMHNAGCIVKKYFDASK